MWEQCVPPNALNVLTHWNVGSWTSGSNSDDLGFVDELINHISNNYNIDMKRIYAAGYSDGGFFSQELACNLSNDIAAIGTVAANMSTRTKDNCTFLRSQGRLYGAASGGKPFLKIAFFC